jgi:hypothetical protein
MCTECRIREELIKSTGSQIHLANLNASAVYRNIVDGVGAEKS